MNISASSSYECFRAAWSWIMVVTINSCACVASINGSRRAFTVAGEPTDSLVRFWAMRVRSTGV